MTPLDRILRAYFEPKPRLCHPATDGWSPRCENLYDPRLARERGHRGFCSHECAVADQENALM